MATTDAVIRCHDCAAVIERHADCLECDCRMGFVATWDVVLGPGVFVGRVLEPLRDNKQPLEVVA